jgi:hypothetical protein
MIDLDPGFRMADQTEGELLGDEIKHLVSEQFAFRLVSHPKTGVKINHIIIFFKHLQMKHRIAEALEKELAKNPGSLHIRRQLSLLNRASIFKQLIKHLVSEQFAFRLVSHPKTGVKINHIIILRTDIRQTGMIWIFKTLSNGCTSTPGRILTRKRGCKAFIFKQLIKHLVSEQFAFRLVSHPKTGVKINHIIEYAKGNQAFFELADRYTTDRHDLDLQDLVKRVYEYSRLSYICPQAQKTPDSLLRIHLQTAHQAPRLRAIRLPSGLF